MWIARLSLGETVHSISELRIGEAVIHQPDLHTLLQFFNTPDRLQKLLRGRCAGAGAEPPKKNALYLIKG